MPTAMTLSTTKNAPPLQSFISRMSNPFAQYYPSNWPYNPFHEGEVALQKLTNSQEHVMSYAPKFIRPYMPDQHREFYQNQPFLVAAARDNEGQMWSTLITSQTGMADLVSSPDQVSLEIAGQPVDSDALAGMLHEGSDIGLLGIEFATKRRNRVNGRIVSMQKTENGVPSFIFKTDQAFGNCPQYIKPRQWWVNDTVTNNHNVEEERQTTIAGVAMKTGVDRQSELDEEQIKTVSTADTIFVATGYRGQGDDVRFGNDASHRGGPAGFVMVKDSKTLILPDFAGNRHFNSLGNLLLDHRMGITFPSFEDGGLLQLTGWAELDMDTQRAAKVYPGALRLVTFHITQVNKVAPGSLPVRWTTPAKAEQRQLRVTSIVQESADVKSFHLQPLPQDARSLWEFTAGQHLPIQLLTPNGELLRTYSLSGAPGSNQYRISVKREPLGMASQFLHDVVSVGDVLRVNQPAGDFLLSKTLETGQSETVSDRTLVLLSSGIGVTPILSMLHQHVTEHAKTCTYGQVYWIHGARDGTSHPFQSEVNDLVRKSGGNVFAHVAYSKPQETDEGSYDSEGRINIELIKSMVSDLSNADIFMCGGGAFTADIEEALEREGVDPSQIHFETF